MATKKWYCTLNNRNILKNSILLIILISNFITPNLFSQTGQALDFDGMNDYIKINSNLTDDVDNQTIEAWVKISSLPLNVDRVVQRGLDGSGNGWSLALDIETDGKVSFKSCCVNGGTVYSTTSILTGQWYHIVGRFRNGPAGSLSVFINGNIENTLALNNPELRSSNTSFLLGNGNSSLELYKGQLDELRIWDTDRSDLEIMNTWELGLNGDESNLQGYYKFNQGIANGNNPTETTLNNSSITNINGTLLNFSLSGANSNWVGEGVLPVELITFVGRQEKSWILLNWVTASELINAKFEIEKSVDGLEFQKIGEVKGNGSTAIQQEYSFTYESPRIGNSYYRLKQIDIDGQFEYSKIISVNFEGERGEVGDFYPNPSRSKLVNLDFFAHNQDEITVSVFDMTGKLVVNQIKSISNGSNILSFDFSELNAGIYIVNIGHRGTHRKLIIEGSK